MTRAESGRAYRKSWGSFGLGQWRLVTGGVVRRIITVESGGIPVTEATNGMGKSVIESTNGFGIAVTSVERSGCGPGLSGDGRYGTG